MWNRTKTVGKEIFGIVCMFSLTACFILLTSFMYV